MAILNTDDLNFHLNNLSGWSLKDNALEKEWLFQDFSEAIQFINKIGEIAEDHNHHPELYNVYSKVKLRFYTHDEGGITLKDIDIAKKINSISK